ncbi:uncharacterized protein LOC100179566 [Ciona intestinalis]
MVNPIPIASLLIVLFVASLTTSEASPDRTGEGITEKIANDENTAAVSSIQLGGLVRNKRSTRLRFSYFCHNYFCKIYRCSRIPSHKYRKMCYVCHLKGFCTRKMTP